MNKKAALACLGLGVVLITTAFFMRESSSFDEGFQVGCKEAAYNVFTSSGFPIPSKDVFNEPCLKLRKEVHDKK